MARDLPTTIAATVKITVTRGIRWLEKSEQRVDQPSHSCGDLLKFLKQYFITYTHNIEYIIIL